MFERSDIGDKRFVSFHMRILTGKLFCYFLNYELFKTT